jgi:hypothetical protein
MNGDFKSGCSIHIEYQVHSLDELTEACQILTQYQGILCHAEVKPDKGNGSGNGSAKNGSLFSDPGESPDQSRLTAKEQMDQLFESAKSKNVFLTKEIKDQFGKKPSELSLSEIGQLRSWLSRK